MVRFICGYVCRLPGWERRERWGVTWVMVTEELESTGSMLRVGERLEDCTTTESSSRSSIQASSERRVKDTCTSRETSTTAHLWIWITCGRWCLRKRGWQLNLWRTRPLWLTWLRLGSSRCWARGLSPRCQWLWRPSCFQRPPRKESKKSEGPASSQPDLEFASNNNQQHQHSHLHTNNHPQTLLTTLSHQLLQTTVHLNHLTMGLVDVRVQLTQQLVLIIHFCTKILPIILYILYYPTKSI